MRLIRSRFLILLSILVCLCRCIAVAIETCDEKTAAVESDINYERYLEEYTEQEYYDYDEEEYYDENLEEHMEDDYYYYEEEIQFSNQNLDEIFYHFNCPALYEEERPIHSQSTWKLLRKAYVDIVTPEKSTIGDPLADFNGFDVDFIVKQCDKGRGIFANEFIEKGNAFYTCRRTAVFEDGQSFRRFLMSIPPDLACDITNWAYVEQIDKDSEKITVDDFRIMVELDENAFCNHGDDGTHNLVWRNEKAIALRDINAGEEILCNYDAFANPNAWALFGL